MDWKSIFGLQTTNLGNKADYSTDLYVYALTEFIEYFRRRSASGYVAFLEVSKALIKLAIGYYLIS